MTSDASGHEDDPAEAAASAPAEDGRATGRPEPGRASRGQVSVDEIFGDVLPGTTADDRDPGSAADDLRREEELRRDVPPHSV